MANKDWLQNGIDGLTFGERLGDLISSKGITQSQLADETKVPQSAISEYINGRQGGKESRAPDCAAIIALAKYFSVSTDYLLGLSDIQTPSTDTQAIISRTGLTENNTILLEALQKSNHQIYLDFINELIAITNASDVLIPYLLMKSTLSAPKFLSFDGSEDDKHRISEVATIHEQAKKHGCICLDSKQAFEYYCSRISHELEKGMVNQYSAVANWRDLDGND